MTPARARLESIVDAMRRKQLVAITATAFVEMMLAAAILYALLRIGLPNVLLTKPRRLVVAAALLLVFLAALLIEQARQARSLLFFAKEIDRANDLDDHLVSALSFADPPTNGYEEMCVRSLVLRLQQMSLRIPDVRLERLWLLLPALLIAGATGAVEYRRRVRPEDDGAVRITLPAQLLDRVPAISDADAARLKLDPRLVQKNNDLRATLGELIDKASTKESVLKELSAAREQLDAYQSANPNLIDAAMQLGDPSTQRASQLLGAMKGGNASAINTALKEISDAIAGKKPPPLNDDERRQIAAILDTLSKATDGAELKKGLAEAAAELRRQPMGPQAARALDNLKAPLGQEMSRAAAIRQLEQQMRARIADAGRQAELASRRVQLGQGGTPLPAGPRDGGAALAMAGGKGADERGGSEDPEEGDTTGPGGTAQSGSGKGSAAEPETGGGKAEAPGTDVDVRASAPWVGSPVKQIVAAGASNDKGAQAGARAILSIQQRQLESEVRREEVPAEYAIPIRRYFSNLQRAWEQNKWTPSK